MPNGIDPNITGNLGRIGTVIDEASTRVSRTSFESMFDELANEIKNALAGVRVELTNQIGATLAEIATGIVAAVMWTLTRAAEKTGTILGEITAWHEKGMVGAYERVKPKPLDPKDFVNLALRNASIENIWFVEAARNGLEEDRARLLLEAAKSILSEATVAQAYSRLLIDAETAKQKLARFGYDNEEQQIILDLTRSLLSVFDDVRLWLRGEISEAEFDHRMREYSYSEGDIKHIKSLAMQIPTPTDLIRMAVKEAFNPEQIRILGLDQEFPEDFALWMKKQGFSEDWSKKYWIAHWDLPSATQGFEMLHRGVITEDELRALLKALDVAPIWRERLMAISYNPLTRVDVRRMYALGVLSFEEVVKAYKDLGYTQENAERLARFTAIDTVESAVGTAKARMFTLFRQGIASEEEFRRFLSALGWPEDLIDITVSEQKLVAALEHEAKRVAAVKAQVMKHVISLEEAALRLAAFGIPTESIPDIITDWGAELDARITRISMTDLHKAFKKGVIDEEEFRNQLKRRGMIDEDIDILVKLDTADIVEEPAPPPGFEEGGA